MKSVSKVVRERVSKSASKSVGSVGSVGRVSKKQLAVELFEKGMNVSSIATLIRTTPSYVANALIERGLIPNYVDLYTSTGPQNEHAALLKGVLRFKNLEAARSSVSRIEETFSRFKKDNDRRGMHQCQVLALVGKNRAEGIGKRGEAKLFADWLRAHLDVEPAAAATRHVEAFPGPGTGPGPVEPERKPATDENPTERSPARAA